MKSCHQTLTLHCHYGGHFFTQSTINSIKKRKNSFLVNASYLEPNHIKLPQWVTHRSRLYLSNNHTLFQCQILLMMVLQTAFDFSFVMKILLNLILVLATLFEQGILRLLLWAFSYTYQFASAWDGRDFICYGHITLLLFALACVLCCVFNSISAACFMTIFFMCMHVILCISPQNLKFEINIIIV